jgi:ubiquinone biosynthesis protein UbiJ
MTDSLNDPPEAETAIAARLASLPSGSVVAFSLFGPGERVITFRIEDGAVERVAARDHRPACVLAFHVDALADIAQTPTAARELFDSGRLHLRGDRALASSVVDALSRPTAD